MTDRPVAVGVDGSEPSMAAVQWAADEAAARGAPLRLVHARVWRGSNEQFSIGLSAQEDWARDRIRDAWRQASAQHPELDISSDETLEAPAKVLLEASRESQLLVLGSRGTGMVSGFLTGSVALPVVAHATGPVVLVRERPSAENGEDERRRPVVVGLDLEHRVDPVLEFALRAAARTGRRLRVVHVWPRSSVYAYPSALPDPHVGAGLEANARKDLDAALAAWQDSFPEVEIERVLLDGSAAPRLLEAGTNGHLIVAGRLMRRHVKIATFVGPVTHALLHHASVPVAVVPHY
ncbi:universal stress protein [Streptomyces sp. RKND-216]|uniref:universal stress protein n=1 Tax=Streptomyces sp. RKND-216 TaxID=2562581 RepID=UPI00109DF955|nr:universal stress protein [Streptomyces sp. RKND-216]THA26752.1 universal stress protein [Streptomyces sp. RKND-216]